MFFNIWKIDFTNKHPDNPWQNCKCSLAGPVWKCWYVLVDFAVSILISNTYLVGQRWPLHLLTWHFGFNVMNTVGITVPQEFNQMKVPTTMKWSRIRPDLVIQRAVFFLEFLSLYWVSHHSHSCVFILHVHLRLYLNHNLFLGVWSVMPGKTVASELCVWPIHPSGQIQSSAAPSFPIQHPIPTHCVFYYYSEIVNQDWKPNVIPILWDANCNYLCTWHRITWNLRVNPGVTYPSTCAVRRCMPRISCGVRNYRWLWNAMCRAQLTARREMPCAVRSLCCRGTHVLWNAADAVR